MDYRNQSRLLTEDAKKISIHMLGGGAVNSFVAMMLAKQGFPNIELWDGDTVSNHNIPGQMFPLTSIGKNKAEAVAEMCMLFGGVRITPIPMMWTPECGINGSIVIAGVDSMAVRKEIASSCRRDGAYMVEARMGGQNFRVYTVKTLEDYTNHNKTLYSDAEASPERCGEKSIIYTVAGVASEVCNSVRRLAMGLDTRFLTYKDYDVPRAIEHVDEPVIVGDEALQEVP